MTDAPERIWVNRLTGRVMPQGQNVFTDGVEYMRADLASPLAVMAMREAAVAALAPMLRDMISRGKAADLIRALPVPTLEAQLEAALRLPEVAGMVEALDELMELSDVYSSFGGEMFRDLADRTWENARAALARVKGGKP